jgi:hypothetical protein
MKTRLGFFAIPVAMASMLPVLGCPLCWPGYAALLSSLGLGFLASARYLLPLTIALLGIALAGIAIQARGQGFMPLVLAAVAGAAIVVGKFVLDLSAATYAGVALLLLASALSVIRGREASGVCSDCVSNPDADSTGRAASGR